MSGIARIRGGLGTAWMIWAIAAVALTFVVGGTFTFRSLASHEAAVDANLGAQLSPGIGMALLIAWVPVFAGAAIGHRRWRNR